MNIGQEILNILKKQAIETPNEYHNPNFLSEITVLISNYYDLEDDIVNDWVIKMWGH